MFEFCGFDGMVLLGIWLVVLVFAYVSLMGLDFGFPADVGGGFDGFGLVLVGGVFGFAGFGCSEFF